MRENSESYFPVCLGACKRLKTMETNLSIFYGVTALAPESSSHSGVHSHISRTVKHEVLGLYPKMAANCNYLKAYSS